MTGATRTTDRTVAPSGRFDGLDPRSGTVLTAWAGRRTRCNRGWRTDTTSPPSPRPDAGAAELGADGGGAAHVRHRGVPDHPVHGGSEIGAQQQQQLVRLHAEQMQRPASACRVVSKPAVISKMANEPQLSRIANSTAPPAGTGRRRRGRLMSPPTRERPVRPPDAIVHTESRTTLTGHRRVDDTAVEHLSPPRFGDIGYRGDQHILGS